MYINMRYIIEKIYGKDVVLEVYENFIELLQDKPFDYDLTESVYKVLNEPIKNYIEITIYGTDGEKEFNEHFITINSPVNETLEVLKQGMENIQQYESCSIIKKYLDKYTTITQ